MMAAEVHFVYSGGGRDVIPRDATHVSVHPSVKIIPGSLFSEHPNIVEVICHDGVERIEHHAFSYCPRLKRVIIPGVKVVEYEAFSGCRALTNVECDKLEIIRTEVFVMCTSLRSINLTSVRIVHADAFNGCRLTDAKFGQKLESFRARAFANCRSLERITVPLKDNLFTHDTIFQLCHKLKHVDLVEVGILKKTVAALSLEDWRDDMNEEIESINRILPYTPAGDRCRQSEKTLEIRHWIGRVLCKIIDYKAQHRQLLNDAATTLQLMLPNDIVMNNVLPFLELPSHMMFEGEEGDEV